MTKRSWWFVVALIAVLASAPNAMVVRVAVVDADPLYWAFVRFAIGAVVMLPIALLIVKREHIRRAGKDALIAGVAMSVALLCYTYAIYYSQASYVSILTMVTPVVIILISARFFREVITRRKVAGVMLAMIGALVIAVLPFVATGQITTAVYPLATVLTLVNSVMFALSFIYTRKSNEAGMPMFGVLGIVCMIGVLITAPAHFMFGEATYSTDVNFYLAAFYSAVGVSILFRAVTITAYKRIGAIPIAALQYVETLVAVALPILIINERLSIEMVIGGLMILTGVYVIESHKTRHAKRHMLHRHH